MTKEDKIKEVENSIKMYEKDIEDHLQLLKRLENDGFIIVKQTELSNVNLQDIKYKISENDPHPNENYWNDITPKLAKNLNL